MLRDSIERILGVPVVVNAERDVRVLAETAARAIAEAAKRSTRTRELGQALEQTQTRAAAHRSNRDTEDARITQLEAELREIEELQASQQNKIELLARRDEKRSLVARLNQELDEARTLFGQAFATSWRGVLVEPVTAAVEALEVTLAADRELLANATVAAVLSVAYRDNGKQACPACDSALDEQHRAHLMKIIDLDAGEEIEAIRDRVQTTAERIRTLRKIIDEHARVEVLSHEDAYRRAQIQLEDAAEELAALEEQLKDVGEGDELTGLAARRDQITLALAKSRETRDAEERNRAEAADRIERLRKQIQSTGGGDADEATVTREQLTRDLSTLFERAVVEYRDRLRESVQESASNVFRSMRSESDFRKLVINDRYGLRILDPKGRIVEDRSAGYEHLVALSLLGALQECSPISGPIVMDSPFGRLDPDHVRRVVGQLNVLADQVFLLVHEGEIDRSAAQEQLRSRLLAAYELRRLSAYNTRIEELTS
jgi:DNA sulfur modification protein DndD